MILYGTAAICVLADQVTKEAVFRIFAPDVGFPLGREAIARIVARGEKYPVFDGILWLAPRVNPGAAFSLLSRIDHANLILQAASIFFILLLVWLAQKTFRDAPAWGFGLLIGGSLGNLIDRFRADGVLDFIHLSWWPTFNLADTAIVIGVALIILRIFFCAPEENPEDNPAEPESPS